MFSDITIIIKKQFKILNQMKNSLIIAAGLFISLINVGNAQDADNREKIALGLKVGVNRSNVYDEQGQDFKADAKLGFAGGAFMALPLGKYLGVQPEVLISQKGYQATGTLLANSYSDKRTTTYLDIPLQVQLKPTDFLTFLTGVQYSYLLHQKDEYAWGLNSTAQDQEFKNDNARKNILGAVVGLDVNIGHFVASVKACWDLQNNVGDGSSYTPRYKNVWIQTTVGFRMFN
jgi:hypothetical protein